MIIPSRWMKGGKGLDSFRKKMKNYRSLQIIYDYEDAKLCFPSLNIDGGVCYFLWNKQHNGKTTYTYHSKKGEILKSTRFLKTKFSDKIIRDNRQISIIEKVHSKGMKSFKNYVSSRNPFGFNSDFFNSPNRYLNVKFSNKEIEGYIKIYGVKGKKGGSKRVFGYVNQQSIQRNKESIKSYKLYFSKAYMTTSTVPPEIIVGKPNSICTETFLMIGPFETLKKTQDCLKYIKTKFFRALLFFNRHSLNISKSSFDLVPFILDLDGISDNSLYQMFDLNKQEIDYIEETIDLMDQGYE